MHIEQIILKGFKSFMGKSVIDLSPGITTIVGPNGCGKTNIVDALRWTLGEQKPSVLRSGKMEDVIFNGTKTRKQAGYCEVTIHINNDRNLLPIEFDSVSVRRRYYRTGESIYYLNNTKCRLKDIQDLFIDTGMSSDAYSVIELRMIDNIISPNTADRRRMFEEASGINKYKKQRRTSELRLANTSSNMDRIFDILNEVRNNVKSLKLQLKRYDRHEVLSKKLIELNIEHAKKEVYDLLQIKDPLDVNLKEITDKNRALSLRLEKEESSLNIISNNYDMTAQQHSSLLDSIAADREVLADVNNLLVKIHEKKKNSELNIVQYSDEVRDLEKIISLNDKSLADYTNELVIAEKEVVKLELIVKQIKKQRDSFLSSINKIKSDLKRKSKEKSIFDLDMTNIINEQFQIEYKISTEENQIKDSQISLKEVDKLLDKTNKNKNDLNKTIKSIESKNTKTNILIEKLSKEQSAIEQKISKSETNLIRLEKKLVSIVQKIDFFDSLIASSDIDKSSISKILDKSSFGSPVFLGDVIVPNNKAIKKILVSILKNQSSYILVKSRKYLKKILKTIKSANLTFIILDEVPVYDSSTNIGKGLLVENIKFDKIYSDIINHLFGEYVLIDSKKMDISRESSCKYVTEEGIIFSSFIYHASSGNPETSIIGRKDELVNLNNVKMKVEAGISKANKSINTLKGKANSIIKKIHSSEQKLDEGLDKYNLYYGQLTNINFQLNSKSDEIKSYKEILLTSNKRLMQNRSQLKKIKVEKKNIDKKIRNIVKKIDVLSDKINKDSPQLDDMNDKVNIKNIVSMEKMKEKENLDFKIKTKKEEIERSSTRIKSLENNNNILNDKIKEYEKIIKDNDLNKKKTITKIEKAEKERSKIEKIKDGLYSDVKTLQNSIYNLRQNKDSLVDKTSKADIDIIDIKKNIEFIISKTYESYAFKIDPNISSSDISTDSMLAEKIITTEKSIENIGPINMAVRDEYDSENERLLFLENQYDDLVKATTDLKITIKKLDSKAKEKFEQTFFVIKENFKKTFIDFFDGGEADIRIVDEKEPLNSDIEIYASPPGKTPKTIRMLSGGEKALTAIALLFAIYLVKPSPFCVLDEVDAPLDDKNIGKFTSVIKKFSNETQFIIVTHNKLTMTESNYLYGVTQQEPGISKIISAKIN